MILDTSALLSALFPDQRHHSECADVLAAARSRVLSPFVLAEVNYMVTRSAGVAVETAMLDEVGRGAYELAQFSETDVAAASEIVARYSDLGIGLTDASLMVLAEQRGTRDIFTLDERHFRAVQARDGKPFRLLPADR